ncbi:MAG: DUF4391 domain-containing protein [Peptoniphilus grossensis]|uniref:DUF4391 domain-containing protein n=1 Tax=Peptoniphilus grossensis TaxID=1465756 RepID=UPI00291291A1|nr:DUF4391 domain-containing protein [Peptoniphilus grossensis]MDU7150626.1 DUF4391 domain-containing protein [Peptoniphilus grossensis]
MFNLPEATEIRKNIFKNKIYNKYKEELSGNKKEKFDREISKIIITNEISEKTIKIPKTEEISSIFIIKIDLKTRDYTESNIVLITRLFGQNILYILNYKDQYKLAIFKDKLITSQWKKEEEIDLRLQGLNLSSIWDNLVIQVGDIEVEEGKTLEEQIEIDERKEKLEKLITKTKKKMAREIQAKKKHELFKELKKYKEELEKYNV